MSALSRLLQCTALGAVMSFASPLVAQDVRLMPADKSVTIAGKLLGFDGSTYTIETAVGVLEVDGADVLCEGDGCPILESPAALAFSGSRALSDTLIPSLVRAFAAQNGLGSVDANAAGLMLGEGDEAQIIEIEGTSTRNGFRRLLDGDTTLTMATRTANARELRNFAAEGKSLADSANRSIVAVDGLALITHPDNPVRAVTQQNAALAFGGQITNWRDLGGDDAAITLYVREPDSGSREVIEALLMRPNGAIIPPAVVTLASDQEVADAVAADPNGFGFTSFSKTGNAQALAVEGVCGLRTPANAFTIKTEEYPLTRRLYLYQDGQRELDETAQAFLEFIATQEAQATVAEAGFVDQTISVESINNQGLRLASSVISENDPQQYEALRDMFRLLISAERLSTTFRFQTGSARLDARAEADIIRLANALATDAFADKEVLFVGFTDAVGKASLNTILSERRARLVRDLVLAQAPDLAGKVQTQSIGFGEASPLGCNETDNGRRINRRVEVWVRDVVAGSGL